eukprot:42481-Hanusia_phi.AAC.4
MRTEDSSHNDELVASGSPPLPPPLAGGGEDSRRASGAGVERKGSEFAWEGRCQSLEVGRRGGARDAALTRLRSTTIACSGSRLASLPPLRLRRNHLTESLARPSARDRRRVIVPDAAALTARQSGRHARATRQKKLRVRSLIARHRDTRTTSRRRALARGICVTCKRRSKRREDTAKFPPPSPGDILVREVASLQPVQLSLHHLLRELTANLPVPATC